MAASQPLALSFFEHHDVLLGSGLPSDLLALPLHILGTLFHLFYLPIHIFDFVGDDGVLVFETFYLVGVEGLGLLDLPSEKSDLLLEKFASLDDGGTRIWFCAADSAVLKAEVCSQSCVFAIQLGQFG